MSLLCLLLLAAPPAADTLVVCPEAFRPALAPWVAYRTEQGHRIEILSNTLSALELRAEIRSRAKRGALAYVVLVGDAPPANEHDRRSRARTVPTWQAAAKVIPRYGGEETIATDNGYADLDDDALPEIAVGRLTADNPAELAAMVQKILDYERNTDFGAWRRQINLLAGLGGFGPLADAAIEAAARRVISAGIPPEYALRITYGNWRSPFCPDPRRFRQTAIDSLNDGSLCWVYLGHAWPGRLADLHVGGDRLSVARSSRPGGSPRPPRRSDCLSAGVLHRRVRRPRRLLGRNDAGHAGSAGGRDLRLARDDALCDGGLGHGTAGRALRAAQRHPGPRAGSAPNVRWSSPRPKPPRGRDSTRWLGSSIRVRSTTNWSSICTCSTCWATRC